MGFTARGGALGLATASPSLSFHRDPCPPLPPRPSRRAPSACTSLQGPLCPAPSHLLPRHSRSLDFTGCVPAPRHCPVPALSFVLLLPSPETLRPWAQSDKMLPRVLLAHGSPEVSGTGGRRGRGPHCCPSQGPGWRRGLAGRRRDGAKSRWRLGLPGKGQRLQGVPGLGASRPAFMQLGAVSGTLFLCLFVRLEYFTTHLSRQDRDKGGGCGAGGEQPPGR